MIRITMVNDYTTAKNSNVDRDSEGDIPVDTIFIVSSIIAMTNYCGWERPRYV